MYRVVERIRQDVNDRDHLMEKWHVRLGDSLRSIQEILLIGCQYVSPQYNDKDYVVEHLAYLQNDVKLT